MQKTNIDLSIRLSEAYKRIPFNLRRKAREKFCEVHRCKEGTFRHKRAGTARATVLECEWMEKYGPYE
ncbi:hypothetical protein [Larkinella soli]|uniref:hypothetical protein n=1 Tax=Larkinella soli TaxID=1770527 RepID=UPI000FFB969A|nr:hypothetical protein [Larkinella soli]